MLKPVIYLAAFSATCFAYNDDLPDSDQAPCSSDLFHLKGKCGGADHSYLRCPQGYWCSQYGYCGTSEEFQVNATCPYEVRDDPDDKEYGISWDDIVPYSEPAPCSSEFYHMMGKCGGLEHGFLRCPKGYWCSQYGYCGSTKAEQEHAICDNEYRDDPSEGDIEYAFSPDDQPEDYTPQDDTDAEPFDAGKTNDNCRTENFHRWAKCGTVGHGFFRCRFGEWCSKWGYCGKFNGSAPDALCPRETRPNPDVITYVPTPDDDPDYVAPTTAAVRPTTPSFTTTAAATTPAN